MRLQPTEVDFPPIEKLKIYPMLLDQKKFKIPNTSRITKYPDRKELPEIAGVYIFVYDGNVVYVGETVNLRTRMMLHPILKDYPKLRSCYFYPEDDGEKRLVAEFVYQMAYIGTFFYKHGEFSPKINGVPLIHRAKICPIDQGKELIKITFRI